MKLRLYALLASSSILAITAAMPIHAAKAASASQQVAADSDATEEIVVTARRKEENILDVPETVHAVTGADLQKFNITQLQDVTKLITGITIATQTGFGGGGGTNRGLNFGPGAGPSSLVFYVNDAPIDQTFAYSAMYDIGDIEALSGPQGVSRGKMADTGAVLVQTRRADLERIGGNFSVSHGSLRDTNLTAAVGVPLIQDKLGLRIATIYDLNADNNVESIHNQEKPTREKEGARVTANFAPTDDINAVVSYAHNRQRERNYASIYYGAGPGDGSNPALTTNQYKTIEPGIANDSSNYNDFEGTLNWTFLGQKLTAVTGWDHYTFASGVDGNASDYAPGVENYDLFTHTRDEEFSQDVRLSSAEPLLHGYLDYTAGFFYDHKAIYVDTQQFGAFFPGAFNGGIANYNLIVLNHTIAPQNNNEHAIYASATIHITKKDEITAGIRHGLQEQHDIRTLVTGLTIPPDINTYHPTIYNIEASHHFNDDLMVYLRTASTWRFGVVNIASLITYSGPPVTPPAPTAAGFHALIYPLNPETSKDYEIGIKGALFDKRVTFNADYGHQVYANFQGYRSSSIYSLSTQAGVLIASYGSLGLQGVPAKVDFIDASSTVKITKQWSATGNVSWANAKVSGNLPCNPAGITAAIPSTAAAAQALAALGNNIYNTCPGTATTAFAPKWTANLSSEYDQPITEGVQGFVRGLFDYTPKTPTSNPAYITPGYGKLDLYLGVRSSDSAWEVSLYGKNITNNQTLLSTTVVQPESTSTRTQVPGGTTFYGLGFTGANTAGYNTASLVPPREFGITAKYAFGSR